MLILEIGQHLIKNMKYLSPLIFRMKMRIRLLFLLSAIVYTNSYTVEECVDNIKVKKRDQQCEDFVEKYEITVEQLETFNGISCDKPLEFMKSLCVNKMNVTYECSTWSPITIDTSCSNLIQKTNLSEDQFKKNNPNTTCIDDKLTLNICTKFEPISEACQGKDGICKESERITKNNNCTVISKKYGLKLGELEKLYDCKGPSNKTRDTVCLSDYCQYRYKIETNMTCNNITNIFKIKTDEIEKYNNLKCATQQYLPIGMKLCVWPPKKENITRILPDITCINKPKKPENNWLLDKFALNSSMSVEEFRFLNPNFENSSRICTQSRSSMKCVQFKSVRPQQTCSELAYENLISIDELMRINPTLRCDSLQNTAQVCILTGYFIPTHCTMHTTLLKNESCSSIYNQSSLTQKMIEEMNPGLNCSQLYDRKIKVCIQSFGMDNDEAYETVANGLKNASISLYEAYKNYINNMTDAKTIENIRNQFGEAMKNETTYAKIKNVYMTNKQFKTVIDNYDRMGSANSSSNYYCDYIKKTKFGDKVKACFCEEKELKMYCQSLLAEEFELTGKNMNNTEQRSRRVKRCTFDLVNGKKNEKGQTCRSMGCGIPLAPAPLKIDIKGELCSPDISDLTSLLKMNFEISELPKIVEKIEEKIGELAEIVDKAIETSASITISLCFVGSEIVEKFGVDPCWHALKIEIAVLARRFTVSTELNLPILSARAQIVLHIPGIDISGLCKYERFFCKDYCQDYTYYGSAEVKLKLGPFPGPTVYEKKWSDPIGSCSKKEYRVFIDYTKAYHDFKFIGKYLPGANSRNEQFYGSYFLNKDKKWALSFEKVNNDDTHYVFLIDNNNQTKASFPISGPELRKIIGTEEKMTYFVYSNNSIYYTSRQEGDPEKKVVDVVW